MTTPPTARRGRAILVQADAFAWLAAQPTASLHAVVTDPPFGVREYTPDELAKRAAGTGGLWRQPPTLDGCTRAPLPRFTALSPRERAHVAAFFRAFAEVLLPALRPGAHVFLASNAFLSQLVFGALVAGGLEFRGEFIRLVRTLRGGDRPKGAEAEFPDTVSLARGCYEPWGIFRKPLPPRMTVRDCLRQWQTGALRRNAARPFEDVMACGRTPRAERMIAPHPSVKPQALLRVLVAAALPLGQGVVLDPFVGSGATCAAAEALGLDSLGIERDLTYYRMALDAVPRLAALRVEPGRPRVRGVS